jgi:hypothetical protein
MPAPVLTGDPVSGINTYFALGTGATPATVQDISDFLTNVSPSEDTDELDATTFRRTAKRIKAGFSTIGYSLTVLHSKESYAHFSALRGLDNVAFEYGPEGIATGDTKISGTCTVLSVPDPTATVDGISQFTVELRVDTRTVGTFTAAAASARTTAATPGRRRRSAA